MKKKKQRSEKFFFTFAVFFLVLVILIAPLRMLLFNEQFYHAQFEKNNVYDKINETDAKAVMSNLLMFFKGEEELAYFTTEEQSHLVDVKNLIKAFFKDLYSSSFVFIVLLGILYYLNKKKFKENFFKIVFLGGMVSFVLLILFLLASVNFALTFQGFHEVFFPQGNFMFAESSLLITLFPVAFFKSFFLRIIFSSFLLSIIAMIPQLAINKSKTK